MLMEWLWVIPVLGSAALLWWQRRIARDTQARLDVAINAATAAFEKRTAEVETVLDAKVKAETGKYVFCGGAGHVAVVQYCPKCGTASPKWRYMPDEGPVCEKCCLAAGYEF